MSRSRKYFFAKPQRKTRRERERKMTEQCRIYIRGAQKYNSLSQIENPRVTVDNYQKQMKTRNGHEKVRFFQTH